MRLVLFSPAVPNKLAVMGSGWITILKTSDSVLKIKLQYCLRHCQNECARKTGRIYIGNIFVISIWMFVLVLCSLSLCPHYLPEYFNLYFTCLLSLCGVFLSLFCCHFGFFFSTVQISQKTRLNSNLTLRCSETQITVRCASASHQEKADRCTINRSASGRHRPQSVGLIAKCTSFYEHYRSLHGVDVV